MTGTADPTLFGKLKQELTVSLEMVMGEVASVAREVRGLNRKLGDVTETMQTTQREMGQRLDQALAALREQLDTSLQNQEQTVGKHLTEFQELVQGSQAGALDAMGGRLAAIEALLAELRYGLTGLELELNRFTPVKEAADA